ncbi:MAG: hypothetical protein E4H23_02040 [Chrysiogenales bacterium]|nr:MAG: hypothetical protein E4H23_02040 [Chrysiogenales bacterium]
MKKILLLVLGISLLVTASWAKGFSLAPTISYLGKDDAGFKEVYGSGGIQPGLRAEAVVWKGLSIYASYGYFSKKGTTPVLEEEAKTTQHSISLGAAWRGTLSEKMSWGIYAGLLHIRYQEEALGEKIKDGSSGLELGALLDYNLSEKIFLFPFLSYLAANDTIDDIKIKLGGFKAGFGLGVRL